MKIKMRDLQLSPFQVLFLLLPKHHRKYFFVLFFSLVINFPLYAQDSSDSARVSPKSPWGEFSLSSDDSSSARSEARPWWSHALLWVPNRIMDFVDIFRVDVGIGAAYGGVIRVSRYAQIGYRNMDPLSVRAGLFGRAIPFLLEDQKEAGIGPHFVNSSKRKVCKGEVGAGLDIYLIGGYGGICVDEVMDFFAGIFFFDVSGDDLQ